MPPRERPFDASDGREVLRDWATVRGALNPEIRARLGWELRCAIARADRRACSRTLADARATARNR